MTNIAKKIHDLWRALRRRSEVRAVRDSGLLDTKNYLSSAARGWRGDPAVHYVLYGESMGAQPSSAFDPLHYRAANPDVAASGRNLLAHYVGHGRAEGRSPLPSVVVARSRNTTLPLREVDAESIRVLHSSGKFDKTYYASQRGMESLAGDALVRDYLGGGERDGFAPNSEFDPVYYRARYPDVAESGTNLFLHYIQHGAGEGRSGTPFPGLNEQLQAKLNADRETVVLVVHETSRTGAPILGLNIVTELRYRWGYNVVVLSLRGRGALEQAFQEEADLVIAPTEDVYMPQADINWICRRISLDLRPKYAIANSAVAFRIAVALEQSYVPVVALIHEFSSLFPDRMLHTYYSEVGAAVFPADIVRDSAVDIYPFITERLNKILPQGRSVVPSASGVAASIGDVFASSSDNVKWSAEKGNFTIVGLGTVEWRKGVDLFISAAVSFQARFPCVPCRFVWIGGQPVHSQEAIMYLHEQLRRSVVADAVLLLPETSNLDQVYAEADVLFVSSRLDPLPNVAIDAMSLGIPVVSFDRATGVAGLLRDDAILRELVVPYVDAYAAATVIQKLATDASWRAKVRARTKELAAEVFDMSRYVAALDGIGRSLAETRKAEQG